MPSGRFAARGAPLPGLFLLGVSCFFLVGCGSSPAPEPVEEKPPAKLSEYGLFEGNGASQKPAAGVIPYDLTSPLFSDYTAKYRFVKLPAGTNATYHPDQAFEFPVGTIIAKTFAYLHDMRDPGKGQRLLETRLLVHKPEGWIGLPYVWNEDQTEAALKITGTVIPSKWIHSDGQERTNNYLVPDSNQCKGCHKTDSQKQLPIGPKARYLNRDFAYADGVENQLAHWTRIGALKGAPATPTEAPRAAVWNDPSTGALDERARSWLDINCAHCHSTIGPARNSGLDLVYNQSTPFRIGVFKPPLATGRGSGGLRHDIVPGDPDASIMVYRLGSTKSDVMMPELGKKMVHEESLALIREWIAAMPSQSESPPAPAASSPAAADAAGAGL